MRPFFSIPWRHRHLLAQFVRREISSRYKGLFLGLLWSLLQPVLLMLIYYFVFGLIFQPRWPQADSDRSVFALILFLGIIMFDVFSAALNQGPRLVTGQVNYVKKVIFPLEILSWINLGATLFFFLEAFILWAVAALCFGVAHLDGLYYLFPLLFCMGGYYLGLTWLLSAFGVFARDISQIMQPVSSALFFLTPIFYPMSAVPEIMQKLLHFNPAAFVVESARNLMLFGQPPSWRLYAVYTALGWLLAAIGFVLFRRLKPSFADCM